MNPLQRCRLTIVEDNRADIELERLLDFYTTHKDQGNRVRDPIELLMSIKQRNFYIIENGHNRLVAVSSCFQYGENYTEAGGTRVICNGYHFQQLFHWCRSINEFLFHPPRRHYFTVVASWNAVSIKSIEKCGFTRWAPNNLFTQQTGIDLSNTTDGEKLVYILPTSQLRSHAQQLISCLDNSMRAHHTTGERVNLSIDIPILRNERLRDVVKAIADGKVEIPVV